MAPETSTTRPSARAIIRPPAAGLSMVSERTSPAESIGSRSGGGQSSDEPRQRPEPAEGRTLRSEPSAQKRDRREARSFAYQPIDCRVARARKRVGAHSGAESRELLVGLARQRRARGLAASSRLARAASSSSRSSAASRSTTACRFAPRAPRAASNSRATRSRRSSNPASSLPAARADVRRRRTLSIWTGSDGPRWTAVCHRRRWIAPRPPR